MEQLKELITILKQCMPELDIAPLQDNLPECSTQGTVLNWLYEQLGKQGLIEYEEWTEYTGYLPDLKPLSALVISEDPASFIFSLIKKVDWSTANIDPYELPYIMPWLEHINFYLKPHGVRLVNLLPFENAYILCLRDDEVLLRKLDSCLETWGMGINEREAMDQPQVSACFDSLIAEG